MKANNSMRLFNLLYKNFAGASIEESMVNEYDKYFKMFNPKIDLYKVITECYETWKSFHEEQLSLVSDMPVRMDGTHFIHLTSLGSKNVVVEGKLQEV